jgi:hypothetical protein
MRSEAQPWRGRLQKERFVMATRANSHARTVEAVTQPASMRRFADLSMAALLGGLVFGSATGSAAGGPANAVRICGEREALLEQFAMQHDEKPQALGLGADGGVRSWCRPRAAGRCS